MQDNARAIARLEREEARLYTEAYEAYWFGPSMLVPKLEARLEDIHKQLVALSAVEVVAK